MRFYDFDNSIQEIYVPEGMPIEKWDWFEKGRGNLVSMWTSRSDKQDVMYIRVNNEHGLEWVKLMRSWKVLLLAEGGSSLCMGKKDERVEKKRDNSWAFLDMESWKPWKKKNLIL